MTKDALSGNTPHPSAAGSQMASNALSIKNRAFSVPNPERPFAAGQSTG